MLEEPRENWKALFANKIPPTPQPLIRSFEGQAVTLNRHTVGRGAEADVTKTAWVQPRSNAETPTFIDYSSQKN